MLTTNFAGSLDYGLENGPILMTKDQSVDQFTKSITDVDFQYDYSRVETTYDPVTFWESIADNTVGVAKDAADAVWDTATGTWDTAKKGIGDAIAGLQNAAEGAMWSIIKWIAIILAIAVIVLVVLGKTGVLKDVGGIMGAMK